MIGRESRSFLLLLSSSACCLYCFLCRLRPAAERWLFETQSGSQRKRNTKIFSKSLSDALLPKAASTDFNSTALFVRSIRCVAIIGVLDVDVVHVPLAMSLGLGLRFVGKSLNVYLRGHRQTIGEGYSSLVCAEGDPIKIRHHTFVKSKRLNFGLI